MSLKKLIYSIGVSVIFQNEKQKIMVIYWENTWLKRLLKI